MVLDSQARTVSLPFSSPEPTPDVFRATFLVDGKRVTAFSEVWPEELAGHCPHPTFPLPPTLGDRLVFAWYLVSERGEISYPETDSGSDSGSESEAG